MKSAETLSELVARLRQGDRRATARLVTLVEGGGEGARQVLASLYPHTGRAHIVGVTGPPGVGKSTLLLGLAKEFRSRGKTVGIVAVDPTSPLTGGALLGDRIRMQELTSDPGVFIRSMATRGQSGGLARATSDAVKILDAAGYQLIFIESVGAGQAEVDIAEEGHTTVVVEASGLGDEIQVLKSGILEMGDIFVVNKADREGADAALAALRYMVNMAPPPGWRQPVIKAVATAGEGIPQIADALEEHRAYLEKSGGWQHRNLRRSEKEVLRVLGAELLARFRSQVPEKQWEELLTRVARREIDPYQATQELLASSRAEIG